MPSNEDKRAASNLMTNLSGFIITANLSMLAIQGASYVFVAGASNQTSLPYNILSILAFFCFVISIILGGKGITETATALSNSSWGISTAKNKFNGQAILSLVGILLFLTASILFTDRPEDKNDTTKELVNNISSLNQKLSELIKVIKNNPNQINSNINLLEKRVDELEKHLFNYSTKSSCKVIDAKIDGEQLFCPAGFIFKGAEKHPSKNGTLDKIVCCQ
ncbi:MAG: hypothetical protein HRT38_17550 [Alteromonadaceae bacterium]|nr:hypothetical protein [Alteromonadaceae bacterium]